MSPDENVTSVDKWEGHKRPFLRMTNAALLTLDWSGRLVVFVGLVSMFILLLANVVLRYVSGTGIAWAYEIHAFLLPWVVAGGLVMASTRGRNITISLLADALSGRTLLALNLLIQGLIFVIATNILWSSQPILKAAQFQSYSTLGFKQIWGYSSLVYAFASMALIAIFAIVQLLSGEQIAQRDPGHSSLS